MNRSMIGNRFYQFQFINLFIYTKCIKIYQKDDSVFRRKSYVEDVAKNFKAIERELMGEVII